MSSSVNFTVPSRDVRSCIGIVCNGEIEISAELIDRVKSCAQVIGVDGGLNYCSAMNITPQWVVGDFDSVRKDVYAKYADSDLIKLERAKDCTDLEVAIQKAKSLSTTAQIIIFGGLGGRLDHTLCNIFLLLRDPSRVFLESEHQIIFGVKELTTVKIRKDKWNAITLIPLNGAAKGVTITAESYMLTLPVVDKSQNFKFPLQDNSHLHIQEGELIVVLEKNEQPCATLSNNSYATHFRLSKPIANTFHELFHQSRSMGIRLLAEEEVISIKSTTGKVTCACPRGLTVSLIPFYGPAKRIKTQGLKWELGEGLTELSKGFVGISNVSVGTSFSIEIADGELLCILNHKIIDEEMVQIKLPTAQ